MKKSCLILLLFASLVALCIGGALAQQAGVTAAFVYPYDVVSEDYVPPLYYADAATDATMDETLVAVADFPASTWDSCYCPSLYYEAWKITAMRAMSRP